MARTGVLLQEELSALPREEQVALLRARIAGLSSPDVAPACEVLDTLPDLANILPSEGLARQHIYQCADSSLLVAEVVAHASARGQEVAIVGWPTLGYAAILESGGELSRILVIPTPGPRALQVVSLLCEGFDLVIYRTDTPRDMSQGESRQLHAKVRQGTAALLVINARVRNAAAAIAARVSGYRGLGRGYGRITGIDLELSATGPQGRRTGQLSIGTRPQLNAV